MVQTVILLEDRNLSERLGLFLYLGRKSLMGYVFALTVLPIVAMGLVYSLQRNGK